MSGNIKIEGKEHIWVKTKDKQKDLAIKQYHIAKIIIDKRTEWTIWRTH